MAGLEIDEPGPETPWPDRERGEYAEEQHQERVLRLQGDRRAQGSDFAVVEL